MLMKTASEHFNWNLDLGKIALIWRGGCIIRSQFLNLIYDAYKNNPKLINLMFDHYFKGELEKCQVHFI